MLIEHFLGKFKDLKQNLQQRWNRWPNHLRSKTKEISIRPQDIHIENHHYESHRMDEAPGLILEEPFSGVKYDYTENSEFSFGADRAPAFGLDKFGDEVDTFDFDEADDFQDERNRKQNSDLSQRYFTRGL